jgi:rSAM/selenodomain-associated transferase 1
VNCRYPYARLLIFAKAPQAGAVKTRLIPCLGEEGAAALQEQLLRRTVAMACAAALAPVELWLAGTADTPVVQELLEHHPLQVFAQQGKDLGARMSHAAGGDSAGRGPRIIIGTDSPAMDETLLQQAYEALRDHDVVFQPAEDGGYTLIGMRAHWPQLFEGIDWGSERVLAQSLKQARQLGLSVKRLAVGWDLDRPEDYRRAMAEGWVKPVAGKGTKKSGAG